MMLTPRRARVPSQVRRCLLLGADAYVTKPLPLGFFMHLWQYCLRRDPDFFSGIVLNHPRTSGHLEAGALPPSAVQTPTSLGRLRDRFSSTSIAASLRPARTIDSARPISAA